MHLLTGSCIKQQIFIINYAPSHLTEFSYSLYLYVIVFPVGSLEYSAFLTILSINNSNIISLFQSI